MMKNPCVFDYSTPRSLDPLPLYPKNFFNIMTHSLTVILDGKRILIGQ